MTSFTGVTSKIDLNDILGDRDGYTVNDVRKYLTKHGESVSGTDTQLEKRAKFTAQKLKNIKKIKHDIQEEKILKWLGKKFYTTEDLVTATRLARLIVLDDCEQLKKQLIKYIDSIYAEAEKDGRDETKEEIKKENQEQINLLIISEMKDEIEMLRSRIASLETELTKKTEIQSGQLAELEIKLNDLKTHHEEILAVEQNAKKELSDSIDDEFEIVE